MKNANTFISDLSKKEFPIGEKVSAKIFRGPVLNLIQKEHPDFKDNSLISLSELDLYREKYISNYLQIEENEINALEKNVMGAIKNDKSLVNQVEDEEETRSFGQRIADKVADFGGSWTFIIIFSGFIMLWIILNVVILVNKGFDPYPFILLNLLLSCVAALQAPVIMMSQNRQEEKDRQRAKKDFMINLKSEVEIRMLHEKLDHLIMHQQQELIEIQKVQIEMMEDILNNIKK